MSLLSDERCQRTLVPRVERLADAMQNASHWQALQGTQKE